MASDAQIAANRENALKGGVKSEQGKLAIRLNAVSHGIFSKDALLKGEDGQLLKALREQMMEDLQPAGELETILVERIISSTWRLKRALLSEQKYRSPASEDFHTLEEFFRGIDYRDDGWQKFMKYETALEREIYKAMEMLERLQRSRAGEILPPPVSLDVHVTHDNQAL
jgi:hypothetical protein